MYLFIPVYSGNLSNVEISWLHLKILNPE